MVRGSQMVPRPAPTDPRSTQSARGVRLLPLICWRRRIGKTMSKLAMTARITD